MVERRDCADLADVLAEVATGAASGPDRARVLAHLSGCDACRRELEELTAVADEVLLAAPEHEPPAGFESAVLARIGVLAAGAGGERRPADQRGLTDQPAHEPRPAESIQPWWRRPAVRRLAVAAAATAIALAGAGTVWVATSDERELAANYRDTLDIADGRYFAAAPLLDETGQQVGHVFLYQGEPSWVFAVLGDPPAAGSYDVVVTADDWTGTVARCDVRGSTCGAGATIDVSIYAVTQVQLIGPTTLTATLGK
jgi:hypothetical protein